MCALYRGALSREFAAVNSSNETLSSLPLLFGTNHTERDYHCAADVAQSLQ
jgi:hypothetical protein